MLLSSGVGS